MRISLFWRTFLLIGGLIVFSLAASLQFVRSFERVPPEQRLAWEIASVVNLTRSALISAQGERRWQLLDELAREEDVRVSPMEPGDRTTRCPIRTRPRAGAAPQGHARPGHAHRRHRQRRARALGQLRHRRRPLLAGHEPGALDEAVRPALVADRLAGNPGLGAWRDGDQPAREPPACDAGEGDRPGQLGRASRAAPRARPLGDRRAQPPLQPDGQRPRRARGRPRAGAGGHLA